MKIKTFILLTLACMLCCISCKRAPLSIGKITTEIRELPDFNEVFINDNICFTLIQSDTCYIEITTGDKIIGNITTDVNNQILTICNTNTLNWMRTYNYPLSATLYYKDIRNLVFASSGSLTTGNQYNKVESDSNHPYRIEIDGGSGDLDILINNSGIIDFVYKYGTSHVYLHGTGNSKLQVTKKSYGIFDGSNCEARSVDIHNYSTADCYIWATDTINAEITHLGNIYYKGAPDQIECTYSETSRGKLLPF